MAVNTIDAHMSRKRALIIVGIIVILLVCAFTIAPKDGGGITGLSADDGTYYSVAKDGTFSKDYVSDYKLVEDEIQLIGYGEVIDTFPIIDNKVTIDREYSQFTLSVNYELTKDDEGNLVLRDLAEEEDDIYVGGGAFSITDTFNFSIDGQKGVTATVKDVEAYYPLVDGEIEIEGDTYSADVNRFFTTFWALVPPIVAIVLALITKEVFSSLFVGILMGAILSADFDLLRTIGLVVNDGLVGSIADMWDAGILVFLVVLGVIGVLVLKSGGTKAYGEWALKHIKSRRSAQLSTFFLGVLIFVDDYFNCLTVGSIMRPLTDKFKISRAKLAYLIDSTAAPICIIAPVSSWAAAVNSNLGDSVMGHNTMSVFIECIPFNFYALLTIAMVIAICWFEFDFGPMKKHESNAVENGDLFSTTDRPYENVVEEKINENGHILDLVIPIFVFLIPLCIFFLVYSGGILDGSDFVTAFANADAATGLAMGSVVALLITIIYLVLRKASNFHDLMDSLPKGFRNMVPAILILIFAWTLSTMTGSLGSSAFVGGLLDDAGSLANFLPAIFMLVACFIAFSTGTSWGTMAILLPIVSSVFTTDYNLLIVGISACMAGAVFGDHCSPISDTTIMSSAGAQCSHVVHVSTQAPYALLVAGMSFVFFLIAGFWQSYILTAISIVTMFVVIYVMKKVLDNGGYKPAEPAA